MYRSSVRCLHSPLPLQLTLDLLLLLTALRLLMPNCTRPCSAALLRQSPLDHLPLLGMVARVTKRSRGGGAGGASSSAALHAGSWGTFLEAACPSAGLACMDDARILVRPVTYCCMPRRTHY
jgi:hypothetical protein